MPLQRLLIDAHRAQNEVDAYPVHESAAKWRSASKSAAGSEGDDLRVVCRSGRVGEGLRDDFRRRAFVSLRSEELGEGFDAPGATLKGVVIPKLPFSKPTDPLLNGPLRRCRLAALCLRQRRYWKRSRQQAVLFAKADDRAFSSLQDKRLITKGYGKTFLRSLPSQNIRFLSAAQIVDEIAARR